MPWIQKYCSHYVHRSFMVIRVMGPLSTLMLYCVLKAIALNELNWDVKTRDNWT